jgi:hypothetical protein
MLTVALVPFERRLARWWGTVFNGVRTKQNVHVGVGVVNAQSFVELLKPTMIWAHCNRSGAGSVREACVGSHCLGN